MANREAIKRKGYRMCAAHYLIRQVRPTDFGVTTKWVAVSHPVLIPNGVSMTQYVHDIFGGPHRELINITVYESAEDYEQLVEAEQRFMDEATFRSK